MRKAKAKLLSIKKTIDRLEDLYEWLNDKDTADLPADIRERKEDLSRLMEWAQDVGDTLGSITSAADDAESAADTIRCDAGDLLDAFTNG